MKIIRLTPREVEIARSFVIGVHERKDVAKAIGISPAVAKFHIGNLLYKLNVATTSQAIVMLFRCAGSRSAVDTYDDQSRLPQFEAVIIEADANTKARYAQRVPAEIGAST